MNGLSRSKEMEFFRKKCLPVNLYITFSIVLIVLSNKEPNVFPK